ncbi:hypothetical protein [Halorarius litoreus]|nr:hypothetical protein [Halorarius litoreus]
MFTVKNKATALGTLLVLGAVALLFNLWLGVLVLVATVPFGYKVLRA